MTAMQDLGDLRRAVRELLICTARFRRAQRVQDAWGHDRVTSTSIVETACAVGELPRHWSSSLDSTPRSQVSLLVPHDLAVDVGDELIELILPNGDILNGVAGRVNRVIRHPVVTLLELGGA